jgi:hypothetical protein
MPSPRVTGGAQNFITAPSSSTDNGGNTMAGNETDERRKADDRVREARNSGASADAIKTLEAERSALRTKELAKTGGNRQAGEK